jgi:hypothetical protein
MSDTFSLNLGIPRCEYRNGICSHFGQGIYEFRVGEQVENTRTGQIFMVTNLFPRVDGRIGSPCVVEVDGQRRLCVLTLRPLLPERRQFGVVVRTRMSHPVHGPLGSAMRFRTDSEASAEVQRLASVGFPGTVEMLTAD